ncbi:MAG: cysteine rich repeat-containing protein [Xanthobacteraceae bacterium]
MRTTTVPAAPTASASGLASGPAAAPAVPPLGPIRPMPPRRALMILAQCRPDQQRLCAGVPAGGGKIFSCLAANAQQLSPICYDALARVSE